MTKFIMVYKGEATPMDEMTEEQGKAVMDAWGAWMGKVGEGLVDVGSPFGAGASVSDDGSQGDPADLTGYSIVEAADLDAAKAMTGGHPFFSEGKGKLQHRSFRAPTGPVLGSIAACTRKASGIGANRVVNIGLVRRER